MKVRSKIICIMTCSLLTLFIIFTISYKNKVITFKSTDKSEENIENFITIELREIFRSCDNIYKSYERITKIIDNNKKKCKIYKTHSKHVKPFKKEIEKNIKELDYCLYELKIFKFYYYGFPLSIEDKIIENNIKAQKCFIWNLIQKTIYKNYYDKLEIDLINYKELNKRINLNQRKLKEIKTGFIKLINKN